MSNTVQAIPSRSNDNAVDKPLMPPPMIPTVGREEANREDMREIDSTRAIEDGQGGVHDCLLFYVLVWREVG